MNRVICEDIDYILNSPISWSHFDGASVLVTGAGGMLPAYLIHTLIALALRNPNWQLRIVALVRNKARAEDKFRDYLGLDCFNLLVHDVTRPIPGQKYDYIVHAASQASPRYYRQDPVGTLAANVLGTFNVLQLAEASASRRVLFYSSGDVYGCLQNSQIPTKEDDFAPLDPLNLRSCYGESKRMAESMCVSWWHQYRVPSVIIRLSHTFGPGLRLDDGRVFADFLRDVLKNQNIEVKSEGRDTRSFCYIADATTAAFKAMLEGNPGEAYNVGGTEEISIISLANIVSRLFPEKGLRVTRTCRNEEDAYYPSAAKRGFLDTSKIRALGWLPAYTVEEAFRRTVLSFLQNGAEGNSL
jgi:UDP-glucuronate decarboxylase